MNTQAAERIAALLHQTRSAGWTYDRTFELTAAMRGQAPETLALALMLYTQGLLNASRQVLTLQRDAAILDQVAAERDIQGGQLQ